MKSLFITGAEGFTGLRLIESLRRRGYEVVGGVRNRARKLAFERQHGKAVVCDASDSISVARAIASLKPDAIIHLACTSAAHKADIEPLDAYQSIVSAWANVLDGARRATPRARVILASTGDVYGAAAQGDAPISESASPQPLSTFGSLKATAESVAHTFFRNFHTDVVIARPFAYVGAGLGQSSFLGKVAGDLATWDTAARGASLALPDLSCRRDYLHVDDVVDAYATLLAHGKPNTIYNISSGATRPVGDLVQGLVRALGVNLSVSERASEAPNPQAALCGDNAALRGLGWSPTRNLDQAIQDLAQSARTGMAQEMASRP